MIERKQIIFKYLKNKLHGTVRKKIFQRNTGLQNCCDIDSDGCNIVPTLQCCVAQKIVPCRRSQGFVTRSCPTVSVTSPLFSNDFIKNFQPVFRRCHLSRKLQLPIIIYHHHHASSSSSSSSSLLFHYHFCNETWSSVQACKNKISVLSSLLVSISLSSVKELKIQKSP